MFFEGERDKIETERGANGVGGWRGKKEKRMRNDLETVVSTRVEEKFHRGWRRGGGGGGRKEEKEERPFKYSMKTVYVFLFFSFPSRDRSSLVKRPTTRYEDPVPFVRIIVRIDVYSALDRLFVASFLLPPSFEKFAAIQVELCALVARRKEGGREKRKRNEHPANIVPKFGPRSPRKMAVRTSLFPSFPRNFRFVSSLRV